MNARQLVLAVMLGSASFAACSGGGTSTTSSGTTTGTGGSGSGGAGTGGAAASSSAASGSGGTAAFALTSTGFAEGTAIPAKYTCAGANVSPDLSWTPGPAGTQSYAVVLTDKSNNLIHWVIWDIPGTATSLPEGVEHKPDPATPAGAKQVKSYDNTTVGYLGPCPPTVHTYEFAVLALDVATLPSVTTASGRDTVKAAILDHDLASSTLTGTYTP